MKNVQKKFENSKAGKLFRIRKIEKFGSIFQNITG